LELFAFDEYLNALKSRFDTSAFFQVIKRASVYSPEEIRFIKRQYFLKICKLRVATEATPEGDMRGTFAIPARI
jgi:hypothetical protein